MKTLLKQVFLIVLLFAVNMATANAKEYKVEDVPNVRLQNKAWHVSDPESILSRETVAQINSMLTQLEDSTSIEVAVVVVPYVEQGDCFNFAYTIGEKWGVGKSETDNGLVILLSTGDRCVQFVTGYGIEGILPDVICKRIQTRYMNPYLSKGRWDEGLLYGVHAVCGVLDGSMKGESSDSSGNGMAYVIFSAIIGMMLVSSGAAYFAARREKKCPHCGKHKLFRTNTVRVSSANGVVKNLVTYKCAECGHILSREETQYDDRHDDGFGNRRGGGGIFMGGFGGGGGGFSGGSFGGGSFGGGGAGSRF